MSTEVLDTTSFPYRAATLVKVTFPDGYSAKGTGAVVGQNDVLTATHVIYDPDHGGFADRVEIYPGADYNSAGGVFEDQPFVFNEASWYINAFPAGTFQDSNNTLLSLAETSYDVAVIGLSIPIGNETGWFGVAGGFDSAQWAYALGYPAGSTGMMLARTWVTHQDSSKVYSAYANNSGDLMGPGSSGGPLFVYNNGDPLIIGVKSSGTANVVNRWGDIGFLYDQILTFIHDNDSLLGPVVPEDPSSTGGTEGADSLQGSVQSDVIDAKGGDDVVLGLGGNDQLSGGDGDDQIDGGEGSDQIDGGVGNDVLRGGAGDDTLTGNSGIDTIDGGDGNDTVRYLNDFSTYAFRRGADGSISVYWPYEAHGLSEVVSNVENFSFGAPGSELTVAVGALPLDRPIRVFSGTNDSDVFQGTEQDDPMDGKGGDDRIFGLGGNDRLLGGAGKDYLEGGDGDDYLDGGPGVDRLVGGAGDDTYVIDRVANPAAGIAADSVSDLTGIDTIETALASFSLVPYPVVENLTFSGSGRFVGTGNVLNNVITGGSADDVLSGSSGDDTLSGGAGADKLFGGAGIDTLILGQGNDSADGGMDSDTVVLSGLRGDYVFSRPSISIVAVTNKTSGEVDKLLAIEAVRFGDSTQGALTSNELLKNTASSFDDLYQGGEADDSFDGLAGSDTIKGGAGNDTLRGGVGHDLLDGEAGSDLMQGGLGNDAYFVDSVNDSVVEDAIAGGGVDTINTILAAFDLSVKGANVEKLAYLGSGDFTGTGNQLVNSIDGGTGKDNLNGLAGGDILSGGAGDDSLDGGAGADRMNGGDGNDTYLVDNSGDKIIDGSGIDTVRSSLSYTLGMALENLTLIGSANLNGIGNAADNTLIGNAGNNTLNAGAGNDVLDGGAGADLLYGGNGDDIFIFDANDKAVSGGNGHDILRLTGQATIFDFSQLGAGKSVTAIELIDLTGTGSNSLLIGTQGLLSVPGTGDHVLYVTGDAGDSVKLTGGSGSAWHDDAQAVNLGGITYYSYSHVVSSSVTEHLYVQDGVNVV